MLMTIRSMLICIAAWLGAIPHTASCAFANDTEAGIGIGGLVFTKSKNIEMLSEDLFISSEQIVVKYRFRNNAKEDVTTLVAFPLPGVKYDPDNDYNFSLERLDGFTTTVDNNVVALQLEQKAMLRGND